MSQDINFLKQNKNQLEQRTKEDRRSFLLIVTISVIVVVLFITLLLVSQYYQNQIDKVATQRAEIENNILRGDQRTKSYLIFYSKLQKLVDLTEERAGGTEALVSTYQYFTRKNTAITESLYDYQAHTLELTVSSNSIFSLPELFSLIQDQNFQKTFQSVEILSLNRLGNGTYSLKILLEI
ncbi:MAG: hypothetical protein Q4G02_00810 [bacterium]|nr:hypothetical protein [bacterium]